MANKSYTGPMTGHYNFCYKWKSVGSETTDNLTEYYNYANAPDDSVCPYKNYNWTGYLYHDPEDGKRKLRLDWPKSFITATKFHTPVYLSPAEYKRPDNSFTKYFPSEGKTPIGYVIKPGTVPGYSPINALYRGYQEYIDDHPMSRIYSYYAEKLNFSSMFSKDIERKNNDKLKPKDRRALVLVNEFTAQHRPGASLEPSENNEGYYYYDGNSGSMTITWEPREWGYYQLNIDSSGSNFLTNNEDIYEEIIGKLGTFSYEGMDFEDDALPEYLFLELQGGGGGGAGCLPAGYSHRIAASGAAGGYAAILLKNYVYTAPDDEGIGSASYRIRIKNIANISGRGGLGSKTSTPSSPHIFNWNGYQEDGQKGADIELQICTGSQSVGEDTYEFTWETLVTCYGGEGGKYTSDGYPIAGDGGSVYVNQNSDYIYVVNTRTGNPGIAEVDQQGERISIGTPEIFNRGVFTTNEDDSIKRGNFNGAKVDLNTRDDCGYPSSASYLCDGTTAGYTGATTVEPAAGSGLLGVGGSGGRFFINGYGDKWGFEGGHGGSPVAILHTTMDTSW